MIKINKSIILADNKVNYLLTINPRSKHIKVSISFEGMKVTIPKGIKIDFVEQFLYSKEKWILEHFIQKKKEINNKLYFEGAEITYKIKTGLENNSIELIDKILIINLVEELNTDEIYSIIKNWYIKKADLGFNESLKKYSQIIGVKFNKFSLREQKTRWGSCSSRGNLNFNWKLIMAPKFVLNYIVVHELCHLIYMNHSKSFWAEVENFMPDYKDAELWLKLNSNKLNLNIL